MHIRTGHIRVMLTRYLDEYPDDKLTIEPAFRLLDSGADLTCRKEFRGHVTAGAILVGADRRILHIHHRATGLWLLPGGHLEAGDASLPDAARRELAEETGIPADAVTAADIVPLHVDIHPIPANDGRDEPDHQHIDVRFLFHTAAEVGQLQTDEVSGAAWRPLDAVRDERLRSRIALVLA